MALLAFDAALLERTWHNVKALMATESIIDAKTKEMIYVAVSTANAWGYCVHSHAAAGKAQGMTDEERFRVDANYSASCTCESSADRLSDTCG